MTKISIFNSHGEKKIVEKYLFIAISFYRNIVRINVVCELGLTKINFNFTIKSHKGLKNHVALKNVTSHGGEGLNREKKCDVLFEWPLKTKFRSFACVSLLRFQSTIPIFQGQLIEIQF